MTERPPGRQRAPSADPDEERVRLRVEIKGYRAKIREVTKEWNAALARAESMSDLLRSYEDQVYRLEGEINELDTDNGAE